MHSYGLGYRKDQATHHVLIIGLSIPLLILIPYFNTILHHVRFMSYIVRTGYARWGNVRKMTASLNTVDRIANPGGAIQKGLFGPRRLAIIDLSDKEGRDAL